MVLTLLITYVTYRANLRKIELIGPISLTLSEKKPLIDRNSTVPFFFQCVDINAYTNNYDLELNSYDNKDLARQ